MNSSVWNNLQWRFMEHGFRVDETYACRCDENKPILLRHGDGHTSSLWPAKSLRFKMKFTQTHCPGVTVLSFCLAQYWTCSSVNELLRIVQSKQTVMDASYHLRQRKTWGPACELWNSLSLGTHELKEDFLRSFRSSFWKENGKKCYHRHLEMCTQANYEKLPPYRRICLRSTEVIGISSSSSSTYYVPT